MKKVLRSDIILTGLAIFSMLFGGGNLMYPLEVGMQSGSHLFMGLCGFIITAILLPLAGLIGMILFNGNVDAFFNRLGKPVGQTVLGICVLVIGPLICIPRIVTLSHTMISPFLPFNFFNQPGIMPALAFSIIFLGITFLATFKENRIVQILGYVISPALLVSLLLIIIKGILTAETVIPNQNSVLSVFTTNLFSGYETLDLLGTIFFASIILHILKKSLGSSIENNPRLLATVSLKAGIIGVSLLALVYIGMGILGAYHGHNLGTIHLDTLFREIAFRVIGHYGAALIGTAVIMACLSTSIALSAVVAEYAQAKIFHNKISFVASLAWILIACMPLSIAGLGYVRTITGGPLLYIGYPVLITLTACNIAYKLIDFKPVKLPVFIIFLLTLVRYLSA